LIALPKVSVRQAKYLPSAFFRFHLTMNTLAFGYVIPAIRQYSCQEYLREGDKIMPPLGG
ncbi:hypothetical protein, partial [Phocaeicola barnesiae]|uniref:hypothetical protein n=1 Tax=Phocaeicola barnesiae TaxID=376804 RepID=UPI002816578B